MGTLLNYCIWALIFKSEFCGIFFTCYLFSSALGPCRQLVRRERDETASQRLGRFLAPGHQPQRPSGEAGLSHSHQNTHIYHIHILLGNPSAGTLALEDNSPGALAAVGGQHFTDHRPLWCNDNLSLTSTQVLCLVVQQEVEDRGPNVVLRSHYRQTEQSRDCR